MGAALHQVDEEEGTSRPIGFFSTKFNACQGRYSTVEKEALALVSAIQYFSVHIPPTRKLVVYTDHNPLIFLERMRNRNQKLMR